MKQLLVLPLPKSHLSAKTAPDANGTIKSEYKTKGYEVDSSGLSPYKTENKEGDMIKKSEMVKLTVENDTGTQRKFCTTSDYYGTER